ncbi:MAG: phytanoyl-CoA dioxygenase family protein [Candidatus Marinimicrobia bacterium]|nr:phytanoyl-CoA dioxygenase family protein [Candidatus Neomarinimicrobiota bacterium]MCF7903613.1 phytanoyl-CoA dioxygenase family protein [Candidatus Neomarinimicrobiota bacterium]
MQINTVPGEKERIQYQKNGFIHLSHIIKPDDLTTFKKDLRVLMDELEPERPPLEERDTYGRAFTQVTNLWQQSDVVRDFVFNEGLARIAAAIMGVDSVRLYHDQALFKEPGGGPTPWHVDQVYWPLDTNNTCTLWIPLQDVPLEMGALGFAAGTHTKQEGRDLLISDESETFYSDWVGNSGFSLSQDAFELGDISIHNGWTVHFAGSNRSAKPREVMTIIYMDAETRLLKKPSDTQLVDRDAFIPGVKPGGLADTHLNPILYPGK